MQMTIEIRKGSEVTRLPIHHAETIKSRWGNLQNVEQVGDGLFIVEGEGHGGLYMDNEAWLDLPEPVRQSFIYTPDNWAEEDIEAPIALTLLPDRLDHEGMAAHYGTSWKDTLGEYALKVASRRPSYGEKNIYAACAPFIKEKMADKR